MVFLSGARTRETDPKTRNQRRLRRCLPDRCRAGVASTDVDGDRRAHHPRSSVTVYRLRCGGKPHRYWRVFHPGVVYGRRRAGCDARGCISARLSKFSPSKSHFISFSLHRDFAEFVFAILSHAFHPPLAIPHPRGVKRATRSREIDNRNSRADSLCQGRGKSSGRVQGYTDEQRDGYVRCRARARSAILLAD